MIQRRDIWLRIVATLAGAPLAACGVQGPPSPHLALPPIDMHTDLGKIGGSTVLAGPVGWTPAPTLVTPVFRASAPQLFAAMQAILLAEPRTWLAAAYPDQDQAAFIVRSITLNLPDSVVVQAVPAGDGTSKAVILSRSRYDMLPFISENRARVQHLVQALTERFGTVGGPAAKS